MEQFQIENILDQVLAINKRYEKISELSGENFNLFKILKLQSSEVRLHSAFIGELLNPKGSHGQKDTFLKLFTQKFLFKKNEFITSSAKIEIEKYIDPLNEERTEGGRIDIFLADENKNHIIIENKIYAKDQGNQMFRYYTHSQNADLFYLTLDGKEPFDYSKKQLQKDIHFKCLSYKTDVIEWLECCRKEVVIYPIIRETITQYINLIKHFTNQTILSGMQKELSELLITNIEASFIVYNNINAAIGELLATLEKDIESIAKELELEHLFGADLNSRYTGFHFTKKSWQHAHIIFQFPEYGKGPMQYGIATKDEPLSLNPDISTSLRTEIADIFKSKKTNDYDWWLYRSNMPEPYDKNWKTSSEPWIELKKGHLKSVIKDKTEYLLEKLNRQKL